MASIAVIGSGFSGLCLGIQLKRAGIESFTIFEKSDRLGGTWRDNTYPGAACDVPSFTYCFSFELKTDWSRTWPPQEEIRDYMEHWLLPRGDRAYSEREKRRFGRLPWLARLYRWWIWLQLEMRFPLFRGSRLIAAVVRRMAERNLRELVADPRLREVLVPDYPVGGK